MHDKEDLDPSTELSIPTDHIDAVCAILQDISKALTAGRSVLVGIDTGPSMGLHIFASPGSPNTLLMAEKLYKRVLSRVADEALTTAPGVLH